MSDTAAISKCQYPCCTVTILIFMPKHAVVGVVESNSLNCTRPRPKKIRANSLNYTQPRPKKKSKLSQLHTALSPKNQSNKALPKYFAWFNLSNFILSQCPKLLWVESGMSNCFLPTPRIKWVILRR